MVALAGCPTSHTCGPGSATGDLAVAADTMLAYGNFGASPNNDCPDPTAPTGVVSLTITGGLVGGTGFFTVCIGRPDLLGTEPLALGGKVQVVDVSGSSATCTYSLSSATPPSGDLSATGVCGDGTDHGGFAMTVTGNVQLARDCGGTKDTVPATISGTVPVHGP